MPVAIAGTNARANKTGKGSDVTRFNNPIIPQPNPLARIHRDACCTRWCNIHHSGNAIIVPIRLNPSIMQIVRSVIKMENAKTISMETYLKMFGM